MRSQFISLSVVGALFFSLPLHAADDSQTPLSRLKSAADLTSLEGRDLRPWHWKLDISVFDQEGKNPKAGSLEMWFSDGNLRTVASLGSRQITTLRIGDKLYRSARDEKDFSGLRTIEMQALHPIPDEVVQSSTDVKVVPESAGTLKLDCMIPTVAQPAQEVLPGTQSVSFCFAQNTPQMLVMQEPGNFSIVRARVGMFQSHQIPVDLQVFAGTVMLLEAKTTLLASEPIDPSLFQIQPGMGPINGPVELPVSDVRSLILIKSPPVLSPEQKQHHVAGIVTFDATIGKDGHVASLHPLPQSNAALTGSAKEAVGHWLFRPYLINGIPVEVKTQLTVIYNPAALARDASRDMPDPQGDSIKGK